MRPVLATMWLLLPMAAEGQPMPCGREPARPATLDERVRAWWQDDARQHQVALRWPLRAIDLAASPGLVVAPPLVWGLAAAHEAPGVERTWRRTTEAVALGVATTTALKLAFGRSRPQEAGRSDRWDAWRGLQGGNWQSFPSGHTTVAFAAATTWALEASPGARPGVALGAAAFATAAGVARMYFDRHWLTDVLAGAVVGTASAFVVRELHR